MKSSDDLVIIVKKCADRKNAKPSGYRAAIYGSNEGLKTRDCYAKTRAEALEGLIEKFICMNGLDIRHQLQSEATKVMSDWTHEDLVQVLQRTRGEKGGLSLMEIAQCFSEVFFPEEIAMIKNNL